MPDTSNRPDATPVSPATILIVEDQQMFRELLRAKCEHEYGFRVIAAVETGEAGRKLAIEQHPDVLLLDIHLGDIDGVDLAIHMKRLLPRMKILLISSECREATAKRIEASPADGYIDKNESVAELSKALRDILDGNRYYSRMFREVRRTIVGSHDAWTKILSNTERLILPRLCAGLEVPMIASELAMTETTVIWHRKNIMAKLELSTPQALMHFGLEKGFVSFDSGQVRPVSMPQP